MTITDRLNNAAPPTATGQDLRDGDTIRITKTRLGSVKIEIVRGKTVLRNVLTSSRDAIGKTVAEHFAL